jgi:hypothetical protein
VEELSDNMAPTAHWSSACSIIVVEAVASKDFVDLALLLWPRDLSTTSMFWRDLKYLLDLLVDMFRLAITASMTMTSVDGIFLHGQHCEDHRSSTN